MVVPLNAVYNRDELTKSLHKEILKKSNLNEGDFKITYLGDDVKLPASGVEFKWANFPQNLNVGYRIFSLDVYYDKSKILTKRLKFSIEKKTKLAVVKRDIKKNTLIRKEDFEFQLQFVSDTNQGFVTKDVSGYTALVDIPANSVIKRKQVRKMFAVERGTEVDIVYTKAGLVVRGKGRAKQSGNIGDTIKVSGHGGRSILKVRVAAKGIVVIE